MKKKLWKRLAIVITLALAAPVITVPGSETTVQAAAAPQFYVTKKVMSGIDSHYTMHIKNRIKGARYSWTSTNPNIVDVDYKGFLTAVSKGQATVKCTVKSGTKTYTLSCAVTVRIPATQAVINNAVLENNVHTIELGDKYDFNTTLTPSNHSYKTYWTVEDENIASVDGYGIVRPKSKGMTRLIARASYSKAASKKSTATDSIYINVVDKTARVLSVNMIGAKEVQVTFNNPIEALTVADSVNNVLKDNITFSLMKDNSGTMSNAPGVLYGKLSADLKTLTITSTYEFKGRYELKISSNVKTTGGLALQPYLNEVNLVDNIKPKYIGTTVDDTGLKSKINFSEPIDITELQVISNTTSSDMLNATKSMLANKSNYQLSTDKKSIIVDLTSISSSDRNKSFTVNLSGVKDTAGNYTEPYILNVTVKTDMTPQPQAKIVSVKRENYNTITVTFDRGILQPGRAQINGTYLYGVISGSDNTKVNFTLSNAQAALSGMQTVSVSGWNGYNVSNSDTSANTSYNFTVDFSVAGNIPTLANYTVVPIITNGITNYQVTLTYNKVVTLMMPSGTLNATLTDSSNNIYPNKMLMFTATVSGNTVMMTVNGASATQDGVYNAVIPANFVMDTNFNRSLDATIKISKNPAGGTELPAPTSVVPVGKNMILVNFACKLDKASAETISNYSITGIPQGGITSATLTSNSEGMATVTLQLNNNTISMSTIYPISITGIKGADGYSLVKPTVVMVSLMDNTPPTIIAANKSGSTLTIIFSENITASNVYFNIYSASNPAIAQNIPVIVNGNIATTTTLPANMYNISDLKISMIPGYPINDVSGNQIDPATVVSVQ